MSKEHNYQNDYKIMSTNIIQHDLMIEFDYYDYLERNHSDYIRDMNSTKIFHYALERECFKELLGDYASNLPIVEYKDPKDIIEYLITYMSSLKIKCSNIQTFSFCQEAYIVVLDTWEKTVTNFRRMPYLDKGSEVDFTAILPLSWDRFSRIKYIRKRWKGKLVVGLYLRSDEIEQVAKAVFRYSKMKNMKFVLYIKELNPTETPYYLGLKGKRFFDEIYPINFLRDLCIETITTTHYLYIDGDIMLSSNSYYSLLKHSSYLEDEKNVILFIIFHTNRTRVPLKCLEENDCDDVWANIPYNFTGLKKQYLEGDIISFDTPVHDVFSAKKWFEMSKVYPINICKPCEPYGIIRRSPSNPIFYPQYINYGFNKVSLIIRLIYDHFKFFALPRVFGIDIPHKPTNMSTSFKANMLQHEMTEMKDLVIKHSKSRVMKWNTICQDYNITYNV